ncbi:MAG: hypothetical protein ACRC10_09860 [Thermoguttaceae bacterium]
MLSNRLRTEPFSRFLFFFCFLLGYNLFDLFAFSDESVGARPYEMVWANRTIDDHPPLVDFENLDSWTVETVHSQATFERSQKEQLWGDYVGHLTYHADDLSDKTGKESIRISPAQPIPLTQPFDSLNFWICGNNWDWAPDPSTPQVGINILLQSEGEQGRGKVARFSLGRVRWREWWMMHHHFSPDELRQLGESPSFIGIEVIRGSNTEPRELFFDNLSFYKEELKPLVYEPRPKRGIDFPDGFSVGTNTGPGRLPFPNREETLLPTPLSTEQGQTNGVHLELNAESSGVSWESRGPDGVLVWTYFPKTGFLSDLTVSWRPAIGPKIDLDPFVEGQLLFNPALLHSSDDELTKEGSEKEVDPNPELVRLQKKGETIIACWKKGSIEYEYRFQLVHKTLILDVQSRGGAVLGFSFGRIEGAPNPRVIQIPYLVGTRSNRPSVLVLGEKDQPLFLHEILDHTLSNSSELTFRNRLSADSVQINGGSRYLPKTDGTYNDCFERAFITISTQFEEVLPNIPNDPSPWKNVTGEKVWIAHAASNHEQDYQLWNRVRRFGIENMLITDHETLWRDEGDSFTFRTKAAPGKGGDEGQLEYTQKIHGLGFVYGPYNNYTDYSPTNEYWNEDWVTRTSNGDWREAWARCYNPKPSRVVEVEPKITEIIQNKFHFNTAYCDVHTAVEPWAYVDFDARVPGAGTFAATFYAYGELLLHQRKIWGGPVYSEGNNHWYYCGLVDGNYAQDQAYKISENPWLVDFDLLKIHPKCCNFGMGNLQMFYNQVPTATTVLEQDAILDRFLAATLAFGHTGFLALERGFSGAIRSYFTVQQLHARYALQNIRKILYADSNGIFFPTSLALGNDAFRENRLFLEYEDGLQLYVNGNAKNNWEILELRTVLPPNGWVVVDPQQKITAFSRMIEEHRVDYVDSPRYIFADSRGTWTRFEKVLCDGQLIVLKEGENVYEVIPGVLGDKGSTQFAIRWDLPNEADVVALDFDRKELGNATTRYSSRGFLHIAPTEGAISYRVQPSERIRNNAGLEPKCDQIVAVPGETVKVLFPERAEKTEKNGENGENGKSGQRNADKEDERGTQEVLSQKVLTREEGLIIPESAKIGSLYWSWIPTKKNNVNSDQSNSNSDSNNSDSVKLNSADSDANNSVPLITDLSDFVWLDFDIKPLCHVDVSYGDSQQMLEYQIRFNGNREQSVKAIWTQEGKEPEIDPLTLRPNQRLTWKKKINPAQRPQREKVHLEIVSDPVLAPDDALVVYPVNVHALDPVLDPDNRDMNGSERTDSGILCEKVVYLKTEEKLRMYDVLSQQYESGYILRDGTVHKMDESSGAYAYLDEPICGTKRQKGWSVHPPYTNGVGSTFLLSESFAVPNDPTITCSVEVGLRGGGDTSDGVLYQVVVVEKERRGRLKETKIAELFQTRNDWAEIRGSLVSWIGKNIQLRLIADVGLNNDSTADWGCFSNMRLTAESPSLVTILEE